MALIVEDGTIVAGAESYVTVAAATTYHANRGNTAWADLSDPEKEEALRRATDYMLQAYRGAWKGFRVSASQALDWPRANVEIDDGPSGNVVSNSIVPTEVKNACAEFALRAAAGPLAEDLGQQAVSETVGPLSVTYDRTSPQHVRYRSIDMMLGIYLAVSGAMVKLRRV